VLETIASRCQPVRFDPLPEDTVAQRLIAEGVEPAGAHACARLSLGDAARARRLALGDGPALRAAAERFARAAIAGGMGARPWRELHAQARRQGDAAARGLEAAHEATLDLLPKKDQRRAITEHNERVKRVARREEREGLELSLQLAGLWYRDLACLAWGAEELVAAGDRDAELRADLEATGDAQKLRRAIELVEDTRARLVLNVTEELALEALGYRLERLLHG